MISYKVKRRNRIIVILLAILFGGASLTNFGTLDNPLDPAIITLRFAMIGVVLFLFAAVSGSELWNMPTKPIPLTLLWAIYSFVVILSGISNNDLMTIRDGFWFLLAIPVIFFNILPKLMKKFANILITLGLLLGVAPYIILSLVLHPVWQSDSRIYSGVFPNSNQLGFTAAVVSSALFVLTIGSLFSKRNSFQSLLVNTSLVICFTVILLSNARTSIISFIVMSLLMFWKLFQNTRNIVIAAIFSGVVGLMTLLLSSQSPWLFERIGDIQEKDALSGRDDIWVKTFLDMKILGNGEKYFEKNFELGAHNTIVHITGVNGAIAGIVMVLFAIVSFYYAVMYFIKHYQEDCYAIAPMMFMTCFWTLSMGEGMFGSLGNSMTLAYMLSVGVIIADLNTVENQVTAITIIDRSIPHK
jgi:O-antigen ligase